MNLQQLKWRLEADEEIKTQFDAYRMLCQRQILYKFVGMANCRQSSMDSTPIYHENQLFVFRMDAPWSHHSPTRIQDVSLHFGRQQWNLCCRHHSVVDLLAALQHFDPSNCLFWNVSWQYLWNAWSRTASSGVSFANLKKLIHQNSKPPAIDTQSSNTNHLLFDSLNHWQRIHHTNLIWYFVRSRRCVIWRSGTLVRVHRSLSLNKHDTMAQYLPVFWPSTVRRHEWICNSWTCSPYCRAHWRMNCTSYPLSWPWMAVVEPRIKKKHFQFSYEEVYCASQNPSHFVLAASQFLVLFVAQSRLLDDRFVKTCALLFWISIGLIICVQISRFNGWQDFGFLHKEPGSKMFEIEF